MSDIRSTITGKLWPENGTGEEQRAWFNENRKAMGLKPIPTDVERAAWEGKHPEVRGQTRGHITEHLGFRIGDLVEARESEYLDGYYRRHGEIVDIYDEGPAGHIWLIIYRDGMNEWGTAPNWRRL